MKYKSQYFFSKENLLNYLDLNSDRLILICSIILSLIFTLFYFSKHQILLYNDARSHINIARRVVDSLTPGIAQLGSVWLPLPHLLMLPFVGIDLFWRTGLAGTIISSISYVFACITLYKLSYKLSNNKVASFIAFAIFALNANILYLQTTPMTEVLFLSVFIISGYFLATWLINTDRIENLILSALFIMLSTLVRYDGWFALIIMILVISTFVFKKGLKFVESNLLIFSFLGLIGAFWWFLWNYIIWGDALYFYRGAYSAKSQQQVIAQGGDLLTRHNLYLSLDTYVWSIINTCSIVLFIFALIYFFTYFKNISKSIHNNTFLILLVFFSPLLFNVLSLYLGISTIGTPDNITHSGVFNVRYGLMMIPFIALGTSLLINKYKNLTIIAVIMICIELVIFISPKDVYVLKDGLIGASSYSQTNTVDLGWFRNNYKGGLVLVSVASTDPLLTNLGINFKDIIQEGNRNYWATSLKKPTIYAKWIIMNKGDIVYKSLYGSSILGHNYELLHTSENGQLLFYKRDY